jgi:hypothetical protein
MDSFEAVMQVYTLVARREIGASMQAYKIAKSAIPFAQGSALLALYEAITDSLDSFLTELGEHGIQNRWMWGGELSEIDVEEMVGECAVAWQEVKRLRAAGVTSNALTKQYVGDWMDPMGSRDWLNKMRLSVPHHQDPEWITRITKRLHESG